MSQISFEKFLEWAESRFGDVVVKGDEIMINSIFTEDYKHHLSCNPNGGKDQLPNGVFHCWKTDRGGSLVSLVMMVDKCSYDEALDILDAADFNLRQLERKLEEFFAKKKKSPMPIPQGGLALPVGAKRIIDFKTDDLWRAEAEAYLKSRKLNPEDYLLCTTGRERNRIIIPYYGKSGELIYWNGRYLTDTETVPKYLGPEKECGVGKGDVIYMADGWPPEGSKLYLTEGEFDSKSLSICGFFSGAVGGKTVEDKQVALLRPYIPVLCFDADNKAIDAGGQALLKIGDLLKSKGFDTVYYVRPPKKYKDWNKMLVEVGSKIIHAYIKQHEKRFTNSTRIELSYKNL